jgi:hypothetical protein
MQSVHNTPLPPFLFGKILITLIGGANVLILKVLHWIMSTY